MPTLWCARLLPALLAAARARTLQGPTTPVEKVITLLTDLKTKVETEGKAEAATYDQFACFCKDTTKAKSAAITTSSDKIETLSGNIQQGVTSKATKAAELAKRKTKEEELTATLSETQLRCQKEATEFEATLAELAKAVSSVTKAVDAMKKWTPGSLLELGASVSDSLMIADALGIVGTGKLPAAQALLQEGVDPDSPGYKYHSSEIISTLEKLLTDFTIKKTDTQTESDKAKAACDSLKAGTAKEMSDNSGIMTTLAQDIDTLQAKIATDRGSLVSEESLLKDDKLYLNDLTAQCEARAQDWDQRSKMRNDELTALAEALAIIKDGRSSGDGPKRSVKDLDQEVNKRALLQQRPPQQGSGAEAAAGAAAVGPAANTRDEQAGQAAAPAFLQAIEEHSQRQTHGLRGGKQPTRIPPELLGEERARQRKALAQLQQEGMRLGSRTLTSLASQAMADPFQKVKQLVQQLIGRLLSEATKEATKKGFCDQEVGKATQSRNFRRADAKKLSAQIGELKAKKVGLEEDIKELNSSLATARSKLNDTTVLRAADKEQNLETLETAKEGLEAVTEAIGILTAFYKEAAKAAAALLQAAPGTSGPGFEGSYTGQQDGATGVIKVLEVIQSDFQRTLRLTEESERAAAGDFVKFDRTSKVDIEGKETALELDQEDLQTTSDAITQGLGDLTNTQDLLDSALKALEDLKPMCIDNTMTFAERTAKRQEEIAALRKALTYLTPST